MEPSGGNGEQTVANRRSGETAETSQTVAMACHPLPLAAHGKEGVDCAGLRRLTLRPTGAQTGAR